MWNRKDVKAKGMKAFKANMWKCVATLILVAAIGGGSAAFHGGFTVSQNAFGNHHQIVETTDMENDELEDLIGETEEITEEETGIAVSLESDLNDMTEEIDNGEVPVFVMIALGLIVGVVGLAIAAVGIVFNALIVNPVKLGSSRFFRRNLEEPASMDNLMFAFKNHYKNVAKTMFMRDLFVGLWTLVFVIPGIVKAYEYRLVDYILSETPDMDYKTALAESSKLMKGNKWNAFVLDLSFIGWNILDAMTCGILGVFFLNPYKMSTDAALYEAIKYGTTAA